MKRGINVNRLCGFLFALGWWGGVAGVVGVVESWLVLAYPDLSLAVKMAGVLPIVLYEIALGIWLLFRG